MGLVSMWDIQATGHSLGRPLGSGQTISGFLDFLAIWEAVHRTNRSEDAYKPHGEPLRSEKVGWVVSESRHESERKYYCIHCKEVNPLPVQWAISKL